MAGLVDYEAFVLDLRGALRERPSWGRSQVLELIDDLEQRHRIDESADAATLRRFGDHLTDTFLGLLPTPVTPTPLSSDDRPATSVAMGDGTASDPPTRTEDACPTHPSPPAQASRPTGAQRATPASLATAAT